jgi:hypothetical protein
MFANTIGNFNTAAGNESLTDNVGGDENTAAGYQSLRSNTFGRFNTASGSQSLFSNTTGEENTASGHAALNHTTIGQKNTAIGGFALSSNIVGNENTGIGFLSQGHTTTGNFNTTVGSRSFFSNVDGNSNTVVGNNALIATQHASDNTVIGSNAAANFNMGAGNTIIGANADAAQNNLTNAAAIGAGATVNASNKIRIGNSAVTVIEGAVPFTTPSDGRFKFQVKEDVKGLDFIMKLRPVTYLFDARHFDEQWDLHDKTHEPPSGMLQVAYDEAAAVRRTGFIAQEVETAANETGYDFSGIIKPRTWLDHYSLSYESFVVPLVKAVQDQQQMISLLKKQNAEQKLLNEDLLKRISTIEAAVKK